MGRGALPLSSGFDVRDGRDLPTPASSRSAPPAPTGPPDGATLPRPRGDHDAPDPLGGHRPAIRPAAADRVAQRAERAQLVWDALHSAVVVDGPRPRGLRRASHRHPARPARRPPRRLRRGMEALPPTSRVTRPLQPQKAQTGSRSSTSISADPGRRTDEGVPVKARRVGVASVVAAWPRPRSERHSGTAPRRIYYTLSAACVSSSYRSF